MFPRFCVYVDFISDHLPNCRFTPVISYAEMGQMKSAHRLEFMRGSPPPHPVKLPKIGLGHPDNHPPEDCMYLYKISEWGEKVFNYILY